MKRFVIRLLLLTTIFSYCSKCYAQYDTINKHVIIAFDNALPYEDYRNALKNKDRIESTISELIIDMQLQKGDYYSLINFGISANAPNINKLARPIIDRNGNKIIWREFDNISKMFTQGSWFNMVYSQGISLITNDGSPFSLLTGAKAYSISCLSKPEGKKVACKTYLVMITDDHYNGNDDQNKEFDQMKATRMNKTEFLNQCYDVAKYFNFRYSKAVVIDKSYATGALQAFLYEVVPAMSVSLNSVVDYPANMGLTRVNGGYRLAFDFKSVSDIHRLKCLKLSIIDKNGNRNSYTYNDNGRVEIMLPMSDFKDSVVVEMSSWLLQIDGVYNGALLSPKDKEFQRLNVRLIHALKNEVYLFGLLPIPDWMWAFTNDWHKAVITWNLLTLSLVVILMWYLVLWLIRINTTYIPDNKKLTIKRIK